MTTRRSKLEPKRKTGAVRSGSPTTGPRDVARAAEDGAREALRSLPSVSALLGWPSVKELVRERGHVAVVEAVRNAVAEARRDLLEHRTGTVSEEAIRRHLDREASGSLSAVLNATGVVIHTNLGRAPLARRAIEAIAQVGGGYSTLEYDLDAGQRGDRAAHAVDLLTALTGAEDALVVNNNAAAVLLALSVWAAGREVIVSRGELVEIGGGFRIPDVLRQSGARLVEVGTTNRTRVADYANALGPDTALVLKVHRSNFDMVGFAAEVTLAQLSRVARPRGLPLFYDAGSGNLLADLLHPTEVPVSAHVRAGADVVMFSGDKLLGGPQAGIVVGRTQFLSPMRQHPLMRALRPDKLCLAALRATLLLLRDAPHEVPVVRMLRIPVTDLRERALRLLQEIRSRGYADAQVVEVQGRVGGGAAPSHDLESCAVRLGGCDAEELCRALREGAPPIIARIVDGATLLDLRCVPPEMDAVLARAVVSALLENGRGQATLLRE